MSLTPTGVGTDNPLMSELLNILINLCHLGYLPLNHFLHINNKAIKIGQGQNRFIIQINVVDIQSAMLYAKFQDNQNCGSKEEDLKTFTIYELKAIFVM